jgi:flavin reductase (DIM6/NTAB) family NADH-FMN oxidoreductase RutF
MPSGLYLVGSRFELKRNLMTLNLATQVSTEPKLIGIVVERSEFTHQLIHDGGAYSLCIIDREDRAIVRKFVKPVEVDEAAHTLNGFPYHDGPTTGVPVLDQAVAWLECQVRQEVEVGNHTFFIGEVVNAGFQRAEETPVLRMEDTRMSYGG